MKHFTTVDILLIILAVGVALFFLGFILVTISSAARELYTPWAK